MNGATRSVPIGAVLALLAIGAALAGWYGGGRIAARGGDLRTFAPDAPPVAGHDMGSAAVENLEAQAAKLAARPGATCPQDFSALATGRPLRIALFYGYEEQDGRVLDRANAAAMAQVLTEACRGQLSICGFSRAASSQSVLGLTRTLAGRSVEVRLFTSSLAEESAAAEEPAAGERDQEGLSRSVKERFLRELVESDVVFYMGHSRLGGSIGFDRQSGVTTVVNAVLRRPMLPVLEALRRRPTRLRILGMFSCRSNDYFRQDFQAANPALSLILTTGEDRYGPSEQASLGALEAILSQRCGHAFHQAMISVSEPDPTMTYLFRGR